MHASPSVRAPQIILDLSRLLSRLSHETPTGVDRCEMAYARGLLASAPERLSFGAFHPAGSYGRIPRSTALRFLDNVEERWGHRGFLSKWDKRLFALRMLAMLRPRRVPPQDGGRRVYVQASPNNLVKQDRMAAILHSERAKFVCLVHDLIPLQFPEYARVGGAIEHARRIETLAQLGDGVIANSRSTLDTLQPYLTRSGRHIETMVGHLGVHSSSHLPALPATRPYFVCIGTIEPRKNHLLLLHIWRDMSERLGAANIPKLIIIGRRGWENEQVVDVLERCSALAGCVEEFNNLPDDQVSQILKGARALLLPSFAEGYGMPVSEALALDVPVICSDLPALREAGGGCPDFLSPIDGKAWLHLIQAYCRENSEDRTAQFLRIASWRQPNWSDHIALLLNMIETVTA